jgi:hypothetical protein
MIKKHGQRDHSYPFDWLFSTLDVVAACITDRFAAFLDVSQHYNFVASPTGMASKHTTFTPALEASDHLAAHHVEHGTTAATTGVFCNHHDIRDPATFAAFQRRCKRFLDAIAPAQEGHIKEPVTLVYLNRQTDDTATLKAFVAAAHFPPHVRVLAYIEKRDCGGSVLVHASPQLTIYHTDSPDRLFSALAIQPPCFPKKEYL